MLSILQVIFAFSLVKARTTWKHYT